MAQHMSQSFYTTDAWEILGRKSAGRSKETLMALGKAEGVGHSGPRG